MILKLALIFLELLISLLESLRGLDRTRDTSLLRVFKSYLGKRRFRLRAGVSSGFSTIYILTWKAEVDVKCLSRLCSTLFH